MPGKDLDRFAVSGWDEDIDDIQEEKNPHGLYLLFLQLYS